MRFEYSRWNKARESFEQRLNELMKLYQLLLNKTAGDPDEALKWLDLLAQRYGLWGDGLDFGTFKQKLQESREIEADPSRGGRFNLTPKGEQTMRRQAMEELFGDLMRKGGPGEHRSRVMGEGGERQPSVRPYQFGDDIWSLSSNDTLREAVKHSMAQGLDRIEVGEQDLQVHETEKATQCATALLIDCSHSMILYGEDRMTPARSTAMALLEFIKQKFPRDRLHVIAFGDDAVEVPLKQVPYLNWGPYHTNTKAALEMARDILLRSRCPNRQILMITDGKPTVLDEGGRRHIDAGLMNRRIVNRTLDEAGQCRRKRIPITTFMVADDPPLMQFVEELTETNKGRAYYTGLGQLGQYLLVDYINNRRRTGR